MSNGPMNYYPSIYDLNFSDLFNLIQALGQPNYRAKQIWQGLYKHLWSSPQDFTNIPKSLRQELEDRFSFSNLIHVKTTSSSKEEAEKYLFTLNDGRAIETVLMFYDETPQFEHQEHIMERKRRSLCVSSQVGCALGCVFCATGQMGFVRNLQCGEIVEQVLYAERRLRTSGERLTHVNFMGMGEPFHNYQEVILAIEILNHPEGLNLGVRRFTISTAGLVPAIRRFTNEQHQINLAVSLHAADDDLRSQLMPINRKYPLEELIDACREYTQKLRRRITFEWALIHKINDQLSQARKLGKLLKGILCHINLIPLNPSPGYPGRGSHPEQVSLFQSELLRQGFSCTIRMRRGTDIRAGCGQLATQLQRST